jgi:transcription antitermination factor NusG
MDGWYVLCVRARRERAVAYELIDRGLATYLPVEHRKVTHARKTSVKPFPLIPNYIFVEIKTAGDFQRARHPDAHGFIVSAEGTPMRVLDHQLERLREYEAAGLFDLTAEPKRLTFGPGAQVKILDGPFEGRIGTIERGGERKSFDVLTWLFGRQTRVRVDAIHLKAA